MTRPPLGCIADEFTGAIVVALKSRIIPSAEAVAQSLETRLDALHGPGQGFTIACPAVPENQRTDFKGHLFVGDVLLSDSGMRHHPLTPMTNANLVQVMQAQTRRPVGLVVHEVVALRAEAIRARFAALQTEGVEVAIVDAVSNTDLLPPVSGHAAVDPSSCAPDDHRRLLAAG